MARTGITNFSARSALVDLTSATIGSALSFDGTIVRGGDTSLKITAASGTNGSSGTLPGVAGNTGGWFRAYVRVTARPATTARVLFGTGTGGHGIRLNPNGTLSYWNSTTNLGTSTTALTDTTRWYLVEWRAGTGTSVPVLWIDGVAQITATISAVTYGGSVGPNDTVADTYTAYITDWAADDTNQIGAGKVVFIKPTGDSSVGTGWTNSAGTGTALWDCVNNTPPVGVADTTANAGKQIRNASTTGQNYIALCGLVSDYFAATDFINSVFAYAVVGAPVTTGGKTGAMAFGGATTNIFVSSTAFPGSTYWSGTAAGAYPTGWKVERQPRSDIGQVITGLTDTLTITLSIPGGTASRIALCCGLGVYVDVIPATNTVASPATGALAQTGFAPSSVVNTIVAVGLAALSLTGFAPTATIGKVVAAGVGIETYTGFAPAASVGGGASGPTVVNATSSGAISTVGVTSFNVTIPAPTNGNSLILAFSGTSPSVGVASITQAGVTWPATPVVISNTNRRSEQWLARAVSGAGTTVTVNLTGALVQNMAAEVIEVSGDVSVDVTGTNTGTAVTSVATGSITPTASRSGIIVAITRTGGTPSAGPTNGFTQFIADPGGTARSYGAYFSVGSFSGSYSTDWTTASGNFEASIASYLSPASSVNVVTGVGALSYIGFAPTLGLAVQPNTGALSLTGFAPTATVSNNKFVLAGTGVLSLSGFAPTAVGGQNKNVLAGTGVLSLTGFAPTISAGPGKFIARTVTVPTTTGAGTGAGGIAWGTTGITSTYQVFLPSSAALASKNLLGQPYRIIVALHGSAENGTDGTLQMTGGGSLGQLLGWGAVQDGSAATPSQTWPTIVIFPQRPSTWTGDAGPTGGVLSLRIFYQMIYQALRDVIAFYGADPNRCYLTGLSAGAHAGFAYCATFPTDFTAFISASGCAHHAYLDAVPGNSYVDETDAGAAAAAAMKNVPTWMFNSTADATTTPSLYNPTVTAFNSIPNALFHFYESTTYDHATVWTKAYQDDGTGNWTPALASGGLWGAILQQLKPTGIGTLSYTGFAPTISATGNKVVLAGVGALSYTGVAPTATVSNNRNVLAGTGALSYVGFAPSVIIGTRVLSGVGSLAYTGFAPTIQTPVAILPATGALTYSGFAPTVVTPRNVLAGTGALTYTGFAPIVLTPRNVLAGTGALSYVGFAPTVATPQSVPAGTGALAYVGFSPTISTPQNALTGAGAITFSGFVPTILTPVSVLTGAGALSYSGFAPIASSSNAIVANTGTGALTYVGFAPATTTSSNQNVLVGTGALTFFGFAPTVTLDIRVQTNIGSLVLTGFAPSVVVSDNRSVATDTGALAFIGFAPTATASDQKQALPGTGLIQFSGFAPIAFAGDQQIIQPGTGEITFLGFSPTVTLTDYVAVLPGTGTLIFSGFAPQVSASVAIDIATQTGAVTFNGYAPTVVGVVLHLVISTTALTVDDYVSALTSDDYSAVLTKIVHSFDKVVTELTAVEHLSALTATDHTTSLTQKEFTTTLYPD